MNKETKTLSKRHEILFLYDVSYANPNGDPMEGNKPRYDEETGRIYVRDARVKRTIRDTLKEMGNEIFLVGERKEDGKLKTKEERFKNFGEDIDKMLEQCIDIRLFGGTFALKKEKSKAFSLTGPVQFKYGISLHKVKVLNIEGTTVMPSEEGKSQGTMLEDYKVAYALIAVYGIANQRVAENTKMTDEDFENMLKALWIGHNGGSVLLTSSKLGHSSRLLLDIVHKENSLDKVGDLDMLLSINTEKLEEEIRSPDDYTLSLDRLVERIDRFKEKIEKVRYRLGESLKLEKSIEDAFKDIVQIEKLEWKS